MSIHNTLTPKMITLFKQACPFDIGIAWKDVDMNERLTSLGFDDLDNIEFAMNIELELGISFDDDDMVWVTVADAVHCINKYLNTP